MTQIVKERWKLLQQIQTFSWLKKEQYWWFHLDPEDNFKSAYKNFVSNYIFLIPYKKKEVMDYEQLKKIWSFLFHWVLFIHSLSNQMDLKNSQREREREREREIWPEKWTECGRVYIVNVVKAFPWYLSLVNL